MQRRLRRAVLVKKASLDEQPGRGECAEFATPCLACMQAFTSLARDLDMSLAELRAADAAMHKLLLAWHVSSMKLETPERFLQEPTIPVLLGQRSLRAEAAPAAKSR